MLMSCYFLPFFKKSLFLSKDLAGVGNMWPAGHIWLFFWSSPARVTTDSTQSSINLTSKSIVLYGPQIILEIYKWPLAGERLFHLWKEMGLSFLPQPLIQVVQFCLNSHDSSLCSGYDIFFLIVKIALELCAPNSSQNIPCSTPCFSKSYWSWVAGSRAISFLTCFWAHR